MGRIELHRRGGFVAQGRLGKPNLRASIAKRLHFL
jgi:hypothetical protein